MSTLLILFALAAVAFTVYAFITQYSATSADQSFPKRILAAVALAGASAAAALSQWLHSVSP